MNGEREDYSTISNCLLNNIKDINIAKQAHFICSIINLKERYHSLRFNSSESISGVPDDEFSLDPYMTQKYINVNKIEDVVKIENLTTFIIKSINHDTCNKTGTFIIIGNISKQISQALEYTIPLKEPNEGIQIKCALNKDKFECKVDRDIYNSQLIMEEYIIKDNYKEVLLISGFISKDKITCKNVLYEESISKKENPISFRQVSHLTRISNGFSFSLITLMTKEYKKNYQLNLKLNVYINNMKTGKNSSCILENDVSPNSGTMTQGNFICTVNLTKDEYKNTDFKRISVSSNNDEINGVTDLDEVSSNPYRTDEFIRDVKNKKSKGDKINELTDIIDYYSEERRVVPNFTIDNMYINDCSTKGKIYIIGNLSDDINKEIKFDLPFSYPSEEIKCQLEKANKNKKVNITCKSQSKFENIGDIIIEPRLINKKNQEILFMQGKQIKFESKSRCENYNTIKTQIVKKRQETKYTFLQIGNLNPIYNGFNFFMALLKNYLDYEFYNIFTLTTKITLSKRRYLRYLQETSQTSIPVSCTLNQTLITDLATRI